MKLFTPLVIALSIGCLLTACEAPSDKDAVAELQAEVEQLENQLGRLEFRVYELENANRETGAEPATDKDSEEIATPAADAGRYDLTPVE